MSTITCYICQNRLLDRRGRLAIEAGIVFDSPELHGSLLSQYHPEGRNEIVGRCTALVIKSSTSLLLILLSKMNREIDR